jgi:hypothetical protein
VKRGANIKVYIRGGSGLIFLGSSRARASCFRLWLFRAWKIY